MRPNVRFSCAALLAGLASLACPAAAQVPHSPATQVSDTATAPFDEPRVPQYDLSGPRIGVTFLPQGAARSQFGWHFEHQAAARSRGPWLVVERVLLIGGVERGEFLPSASWIFGFRTADGFEFGVGPSASLGGPRGGSTAVVLAAGRTFRIEGVRIPVNVALATNRDGQTFSVVTGWALRE